MPVPLARPAPDRQLLRDTVREQIRAAILDGTLEPGERLHDEELIAWLQVSRTPIREALGDLARAGLVEMAPNRYTRVVLPDPAQVVQSVQTLGVLFGGAIRLAVPLLTQADKKAVGVAIEKCLKDLETENGPALNSHGIALFSLFVDRCGNDAFQKLCSDATDGLAYGLRLPNIVELLDWEAMAVQFQDLKDATLLGDALRAQVLIEAIHQIPDGRPSAD